MINDDLKKIADQIPELEENQRFVLGIDGLSRSGKTTFTGHLAELLKDKNISYHVFHIDDHIVEKKRRYDTGWPPWHEYYFLQWDIDDLYRRLFEPLKKADLLRLNFCDEAEDKQREEGGSLPQTGVVIIEGVFLQRPEWREAFDYLIYLDCPRERRFDRETIETQQNLEKFENRYWKAEDYYLETIKPGQKADLVIQNS